MGIENVNINGGVNFLAIVVAGLAHFILGAIWYSTAVFGKTWLAAIGKTKEQAQADFSPKKLVVAFIGSLIIAYGIARILSWTHLEPLWGGIFVGLMSAICFAVVTSGIDIAMEGRPCKLFLVNAFYNIVGFVAMGVIIGLWR